MTHQPDTAGQHRNLLSRRDRRGDEDRANRGRAQVADERLPDSER